MNEEIPPDVHIVPLDAAEGAAKAFFTYVERASLLGLLVFLLNKSTTPIPSILLGALCVAGSLLFIAPVIVRAQIWLTEWMLAAGGPKRSLKFALGMAGALLLAVCGAVIAIAVGETLSRTFN